MAKTLGVAVLTTAAVRIVPATVTIMIRLSSVGIVRSEEASRLFVNPVFENPGQRMIPPCRWTSRRILRHLGLPIDDEA